MQPAKKIVAFASISLVALGVVTLAVSLASGGKINASWPLVVIVLGAAFTLVGGALAGRSRYLALLYLPGTLLLALGLVFLLNVLTGDWAAWAYAWLLVLAGTGVGLVLVSRQLHWHPAMTYTGTGLVVGGISLAVLFGALTGGMFIMIMAPIILVAGGVALRWVKPELYLPPRLLKALGAQPAVETQDIASQWTNPSQETGPGNLASPRELSNHSALAQPATETQDFASLRPQPLVETLSQRELEVLRLIEQGLTNAQIAERLTVAPSTVKTHINNIYGKLGVQGRLQAVKKAKEAGLLGGGAI